MIIPHKQLSAQALQGVLLEYIAREGTDYGLVESELDEKLAQLSLQLERGDIVVVLDTAQESVSLLPKTEAEQFLLESAGGAIGCDAIVNDTIGNSAAEPSELSEYSEYSSVWPSA